MVVKDCACGRKYKWMPALYASYDIEHDSDGSLRMVCSSCLVARREAAFAASKGAK